MINREISNKKFQMDSLDGLRGFAVLIVVFSHTSNGDMFLAPFLDLRGIGKSGVFLFFLLSAFLLTLPLLRKGKKILSLTAMSHYWQRRFFRIYPLYTLYLLLAVVSTFFLSTFFGIEEVGIPFDLDWHGFANHIFLQEGKGVTWSIAVEFKFYFVLPVLVLAIVLIRPLGFLATVFFIIALILLSQMISPQSQSLADDARLLPYMPIFIIGILLAVIQDYTNSKVSQIKNISLLYKYLGYIGVIGILIMTPAVFSLFGDRVPSNYFHKQFIPYTLFWSFILLSAVNVQGLIQAFFTLPILRFYGALSFSLYLFHFIFVVGLSRFDLNGYVSFWLVLLASTASAYVSFSLIEGPISKYKLDKSSMASIVRIVRRSSKTKL